MERRPTERSRRLRSNRRRRRRPRSRAGSRHLDGTSLTVPPISSPVVCSEPWDERRCWRAERVASRSTAPARDVAGVALAGRRSIDEPRVRPAMTGDRRPATEERLAGRGDRRQPSSCPAFRSRASSLVSKVAKRLPNGFGRSTRMLTRAGQRQPQSGCSAAGAPIRSCAVARNFRSVRCRYTVAHDLDRSTPEARRQRPDDHRVHRGAGRCLGPDRLEGDQRSVGRGARDAPAGRGGDPRARLQAVRPIATSRARSSS